MRFSNQIRETISQGHAEAIRLGNNYIGIEHLVLGLLHKDSGMSGVFLKLGIDLGKLRDEAERLVRGKSLRKDLRPLEHQALPLSDLAEKVIIGTVREAKARKSSIVEANDLMLSIVKNDSNFDSLIPVRESISR